MTITLCDRCKKGINNDASAMVHFPFYQITKHMSSWSLGDYHSVEIALCRECQHDFTKWLADGPDRKGELSD